MKKQEDFQRLKRTFDTEVLEVYDTKLRGNYFVHQLEPNSNGRGIDYYTGGRELAKKGAGLIVPAVNLHADEIAALLPRIEREYYALYSNNAQREKLSNKVNTLSYFENGVRELSDERYQLSQFSYSYVYPAVAAFPEATSKTYVQGLGEMIFHQLRLLNMCHLGELDPFQFASLDQILQLIPDRTFLSEEKIQQIGEGLVKEVLKSRDGCRDSAEARQAIQKYGLTNEDLISAMEKMESLETKHNARMDRYKKSLEKRKEGYITSRKAILSAIGEGMHLYDNRG